MTFERLTIRNSDGTVSQPTRTTIESVFYRLAEYEDTNLRPEDIAEYKKFEDWLVQHNVTFGRALELLEADMEGRVTIRKKIDGDCCGQCHHFLREPGHVSGVCEVRCYKYYPRAGKPMYCGRSRKACAKFEDRGERPVRYTGKLGSQNTAIPTK
mgnify:CR=1 FL=1